jgi:hypothetical protein
MGVESTRDDDELSERFTKSIAPCMHKAVWISSSNPVSIADTEI